MEATVREKKRQRFERLTDAQIVEKALEYSGLPAEEFAREVVGVDPATVRRWRGGYVRMSRYRRRQLLDYIVGEAHRAERK